MLFFTSILCAESTTIVNGTPVDQQLSCPIFALQKIGFPSFERYLAISASVALLILPGSSCIEIYWMINLIEFRVNGLLLNGSFTGNVYGEKVQALNSAISEPWSMRREYQVDRALPYRKYVFSGWNNQISTKTILQSRKTNYPNDQGRCYIKYCYKVGWRFSLSSLLFFATLNMAQSKKRKNVSACCPAQVYNKASMSRRQSDVAQQGQHDSNKRHQRGHNG